MHETLRDRDAVEWEKKRDDGELGDVNDYGEGVQDEVAVSRTLEWWHASCFSCVTQDSPSCEAEPVLTSGPVMIAETVSIGILSLPSVLSTVGLVPGIILIAGFGIITTYTGYVIGQFKAAYPQCYNAADVGRILLGPVGYYAFALFQIVYIFFSLGAHIVTFVDAFNVITNRGTCSIVFSVVAVVLYILGSSPATLRGVSYISAASCVSILAALLVSFGTLAGYAIHTDAQQIIMISTGIEYHPSQLPPLSQRIDIFPEAIPFYTAFASMSQIGYGYAGHITFFAIISDFKEPRDYKYALFVLQAVATGLYILVAALVYVFVGGDVPSPALGAASPTISKVAYGIALVTIIGSGSIIGHVNSKLIYQLFCKWSTSLRRASPTSGKGLTLWIGCLIVNWFISWVISESVPNLSTLLGLISAIFVSWFTFGLSNIMWFWLNWEDRGYLRGSRKIFLTIVNLLILGVALTLFGAGSYASGKEVHDMSGSGSWSCKGESTS